MSLDKLPEAFDQFVERARATLSQEVTGAQNIVAALDAEKSAAQNALANVQAQTKSAQDQLAAVTNDLQRLSGLVGVGHDIDKARTELKRIKSETEQATKALEALKKQRTEVESQVLALQNESRRLLSIRAESEAAMADIRMKLGAVQIGHRP
jgi:predicted  nucleic acid-binding Zn-ribbon protein